MSATSPNFPSPPYALRPGYRLPVFADGTVRLAVTSADGEPFLSIAVGVPGNLSGPEQEAHINAKRAQIQGLLSVLNAAPALPPPPQIPPPAPQFLHLRQVPDSANPSNVRLVYGATPAPLAKVYGFTPEEAAAKARVILAALADSGRATLAPAESAPRAAGEPGL